MITQIINSTGKVLDISPFLIDGKFNPKIKGHHRVKFVCSKCGKNGRREARKFRFPLEEDFLCNLCRTEKTNFERYGFINPAKNKEIRKKISKSSKNNTFILNNPSKNPEVIKKRNKTNQEKYGGNAPSCNKEILTKMQDTCFKKTGYSNPSKNPLVNDEKRKTIYKEFFKNMYLRNEGKVSALFNIDEYNGSKNTIYKWKCNICNNEFEDYITNGHIPRCKMCSPNKTGISKYENEIEEFVSGNGVKTELNKRFFELGKYVYEIDVFLPDYKIGIEFNGLFWHSFLNGKDEKYHIKKYEYFKTKGIELINIFEDEWVKKRKIVESVILNKIKKTQNKIYARKCFIKEISNKDKKLFLEENHLQGSDSSSIKIGMFYNNELVSVMTFCKSRYNKNYEYEMSRFCNKINTNII
jgi:hypothetical protein